MKPEVAGDLSPGHSYFIAVSFSPIERNLLTVETGKNPTPSPPVQARRGPVKASQPVGGPAGDGAPEPRKLFTAGEWLLLFGMVAAIMSASQPWRRIISPEVRAASGLYVTQTAHNAAGFELKIGPVNAGWLVVALAVVSGALLLATPETREQKRPFLVITLLCATLILGVAGYFAGPFLGIYLAAAGGLIILVGGVLRYK